MLGRERGNVEDASLSTLAPVRFNISPPSHQSYFIILKRYLPGYCLVWVVLLYKISNNNLQIVRKPGAVSVLTWSEIVCSCSRQVFIKYLTVERYIGETNVWRRWRWWSPGLPPCVTGGDMTSDRTPHCPDYPPALHPDLVIKTNLLIINIYQIAPCNLDKWEFYNLSDSNLNISDLFFASLSRLQTVHLSDRASSKRIIVRRHDRNCKTAKPLLLITDKEAAAPLNEESASDRKDWRLWINRHKMLLFERRYKISNLVLTLTLSKAIQCA